MMVIFGSRPLRFGLILKDVLFMLCIIFFSEHPCVSENERV